MASAVDSRLAYARLSAVATASRLPTATRGSNNSYTTSWDTTRVSRPEQTRVVFLYRSPFPQTTYRPAAQRSVSLNTPKCSAPLFPISSSHRHPNTPNKCALPPRNVARSAVPRPATIFNM